MPVSDIVYDNWGNSFEIDMLYDELEVSYELTTSAGTVDIEEPEGWGKVTFIHKRDKDLHGFNYEFTGTDFNLMFDCDSGMDAVLVEYAANGSDGDVLFRRILNDGTTDYIEFEGRLNLNTLKRSDYTLECQIERKSLHQLINSRMSTKVNLDSDVDLDENPVSVMGKYIVLLPGQTLTEEFKSSVTVTKEEAFTETRTADTLAFGFFDFKDPKPNTIKGFYGNILGVSGDSDAVSSGNHAIFGFEANGEYHMHLQLDFELYMKINPRFLGGFRDIDMCRLWVEVAIKKENGDPDEIHILYESPLYEPDARAFTFPRVQVDEELDIVVLDGDMLSIYVRIGYAHGAKRLSSVNFKIKQYKSILEMDGTSEQDPSSIAAPPIKIAMMGLLDRILGASDVLRTTFYSWANEDYPETGCGADRVLFNGGELRGAPSRQIPLTTTMKDMLMSMNAIDCIGMGYEWDAAEEKETIRIESADYFFKDIEIMQIGEIFDYREETAKDLIFNKVVVGYDKYKEEDEYSFDEIHAVHEYQTPIKTESNEYSQMSKYNASGYLIEVTRRIRFEDEPDNSTTYDDDIFILHVSYFDPELGIGGVWVPVTDEPFDLVTGVLDPTTTVNMTLSPKRMLMAHSRFLMSSLIYKDASQPIKCTFVKQNKDFTTVLKADYCKRGDESLLPLRAADDILIGAFRPDLDGIYSPEWVWFKCRMGMSQVRYIMNAHRGLNEDGKNYGYLSYPTDLIDEDESPILGKGWIYEISYNRDVEEVSFKLLKKKFL
jgi:hypothetical protein